MKKFLTVREAKREFGVSETLIRAMIRRGEIAGFHATDRPRSRFYIESSAFGAKLESMCAASVTSGGAAAGMGAQ